MPLPFRCCTLLVAVFVSAFFAAAPLSRAEADPAAFAPEKLRKIDAVIATAIAEKRCPGGVLWLEHEGAVYHRAYGERAVEPEHLPMAEDAIFDAASLTKVVATAPAAMMLVEQGSLELDAPVSRYLPEFCGEGKEAITVRQLLTHTSGLRADLPSGGPAGAAITFARVCAEPLPDPPGQVLRYSDLNFILLGELVSRLSGVPLDRFCAEHLFGPLGMRDTSFRPPDSLLPRIAPTTRETPPGTVHDPTAQLMGGVAGHAGLFTTAADLARYARMWLGRGTLGNVQILRPETVHLMTTVQTPAAILERRGLGWDIDSKFSGPRGIWFPRGSFGHTGWTGTSLWIDPFSRTFVIFLSNRNHPTESGSVIALRREIGTLAAESIREFDFHSVPGALPYIPGSGTTPPPAEK